FFTGCIKIHREQHFKTMFSQLSSGHFIFPLSLNSFPLPVIIPKAVHKNNKKCTKGPASKEASFHTCRAHFRKCF
ncbi:MAG: hypothetical protein ACLS6H_13430, partial [Clostridium sp.]